MLTAFARDDPREPTWMSPFELNLAKHEVVDGALRYFRAEQFTVLLVDEEQRRTTQLLQIQMRKNGQLFAQCPPATISQPQLLMLGGWDARSLNIGPGDSVRFLAFMYPAGNIDDMKRRLGSIDYPSSQHRPTAA